MKIALVHNFSQWKLTWSNLLQIKDQSCNNIGASQLIGTANEFTGLYMMAILAFHLIASEGPPLKRFFLYIIVWCFSK